jgi:hypothetical protein
MLNTADDMRAYLAHIQDNRSVDETSFSAYAPMIAGMNSTVLQAARNILVWTDEPSDFTRFLKEGAR